MRLVTGDERRGWRLLLTAEVVMLLVFLVEVAILFGRSVLSYDGLPWRAQGLFVLGAIAVAGLVHRFRHLRTDLDTRRNTDKSEGVE